ncbi:phospholipase D-like domain-containing protein [Thermosynechococcaceae cyanobacterium BACA0444]|uniref:Phospholipase D-like domain-containing protein n=1 Tax=Pseudocalidococcus azoricus BACA0444 TaxID=2918990 RepID=A0AAE4FTD2_9CYAN|nr:helicase-related protein [Pseudocalidococcus azoricus]MDS3860979.1 phospholipase D-like domain-containing protein [Pseudocalidococcus azoricus BACA0444]
MSSIYDNIEQPLLPELQAYLKQAYRADFCVGYFNLRGWRQLDHHIELFSGGAGQQCRLLVGMYRPPQEELKQALAIGELNHRIDRGKSLRLKTLMAQEFRQQLTYGAPTVADEAGLKRLREQLLSQKLTVKLFLRHLLHAKLYLIYRQDRATPIIGYVGSSNLTLSGLSKQGELNVEIVDRDDNQKLEQWFQNCWEDNFCLDISQELAEIIDESWAGRSLKPYLVYLKMAYHLSQEARDGLSQFRPPSSFGLLRFQEAAVQIGAHHVNKRNGVVIGDVVGLGKTLVGTAIAHLCEEEFGTSTLIICPKNLISMWQSYVDNYGLRGKVIPISRVIQELPNVPARYRLVLIDESHNLRNKEGKRYQAINKYIEESGSRCILLTATPYNKTYLDLSAQLSLFLNSESDIGIKPEAYIRNLGGEMQFQRQHSSIPVRSLLAFEQSPEPEDWQQLMSRYMVRRTRSFIKSTYAKQDERGYYLEFPSGEKFYFPTRYPRTVQFPIGEPARDPYARLFGTRVVDVINALNLPRYGLGEYIEPEPATPASLEEERLLVNLSQAGQRLMGFCRTNLFKRLESSGAAFLLSLERHILRNYVYLYALQQNLPLPIGAQDAKLLDAVNEDEDENSLLSQMSQDLETESDTDEGLDEDTIAPQKDFQQRAAEIYTLYRQQYPKRFKWIRPDLFLADLADHLQEDISALEQILNLAGTWNPGQDQKLTALIELLQTRHPTEKVLIFTQFADTARYLEQALKQARIDQIGLATGQTATPTELAHRFSPVSNGKQIPFESQLRVLIATDVLSEGQNLQDCAIILNYDLPWAIIRLIQRAGRVDRIGQQAEKILCYSFLPADGVEELINLRGRLLHRLNENQEVVGTDEAFFEDEEQREALHHLYNEKSGVLDEEDEGDVDLTSEALQIWQSAIDARPELKGMIEKLPDVVFATRDHEPSEIDPEGVLVYLRTPEGTDALAWIDKAGNSVTQSQMRILRQARCSFDTLPLPRHPQHHELVKTGAELIAEQAKRVPGTLGHKRSAAARTYDRLMAYTQRVREKTPLLATGSEWESLERAIGEIHNHPLKQKAIADLNRELKTGISDEQLAQRVIFLREHDALCVINPEEQRSGAQIICSMGLFNQASLTE